MSTKGVLVLPPKKRDDLDRWSTARVLRKTAVLAVVIAGAGIAHWQVSGFRWLCSGACLEQRLRTTDGKVDVRIGQSLTYIDIGFEFIAEVCADGETTQRRSIHWSDDYPLFHLEEIGHHDRFVVVRDADEIVIAIDRKLHTIWPHDSHDLWSWSGFADLSDSLRDSGRSIVAGRADNYILSNAE